MKKHQRDDLWRDRDGYSVYCTFFRRVISRVTPAAAKSAASLKIDTTLTISGYAADAKTVGDKLFGKAESSEVTSIRNDLQSEIDRATDVLSFPMLDYEDKKVFKECYKDFDFDITYKDGNELVLGDIVLSLERAKEQSIEYNHSFQREASYLVVHSVLHLLGYDHMEEEDKRKMRKREEEILNKLNISR